jgi:protocatechuate 3,4-dioxygenase beta subunit
MDNDLVRVMGQAAQALGQVVHVSGRVLDTRGQPKCAFEAIVITDSRGS